jgi:DMSO/TMAO reductase YedYZ molybdopterin-dependent catalytic subunit
MILYIANALLAVPYPPELIFRLLVTPVPGSIESIMVETLGELPKYGTFVLAAAIYALLYGVISILVGYLANTKRLSPNWQLTLVSTTIPTIIGLGFQAALATGAILFNSLLGWTEALVAILLANLVFARILTGRMRVDLQEVQVSTSQKSEGAYASRRRFLRNIFIAALVLGTAGIVSWFGSSLFSRQPVFRANAPIPINTTSTPVDLANLPAVFADPRISDLLNSEVTENRVFYRVDIDPIPPQVDANQWSLKISGAVSNPQTIDRATLLALPAQEEYATLECVSNTINPPGALISNAKWTGVPLSGLLAKVGVAPAAKYVVFRCADGYSVGIPLDQAMNPGAILAHTMNAGPLPVEHGYPLRAIVPWIYGMMNAKWITEIEVSDQVYAGYWQERGWSNDAKIRTTSLIYYPPSGTQVTSPTPIAGVAFAGDRGIRRVEVSTDGGNSWNDATLKKPLSPYSWTLWAYEWTPITKGSHVIVVRATDGTGNLQDSVAVQPFPDGATGYHTVQVTVS